MKTLLHRTLSLRRRTTNLRRTPTLALVALLAVAAGSQEIERAGFGFVDVYLETASPLAAWQFELAERNGRMQVVGIEGGEAPPFAEPPFYDREAVEGGRADRVIVASYSLAPSSALPTGRTRVARLHVRVGGEGAPEFDLRLVNAGAPDGRAIDAAITFESQTGR